MARRAAPKPSYRSGGFHVGSDIALPELETAGSPGRAFDILIQTHTFTDRPFLVRRHRLHDYYYEATPDRVRMEWPGEVRIEVSGGDRILYEKAARMPARSLRLCLLGPALATAFRQRSLAVLHASAVRVKNGAVAFMGQAGAGKSTLAMALAARGYELLTDNVLAIHAGGSCRVWPTASQIKLSPDVLPYFKLEPSRHARVEADNPKRSVLLGAAAGAARLRRIYALERGASPAVGPLGKCDALLRMAQHPCGLGPVENDALPEGFGVLMRVAQQTEFRRLVRGRSISQLESFIDLVERDLRAF